jgi:hypothetical protein
MRFTSLCTILRRSLARYRRWITDSHAGLLDSAGLIDDARTRFDDAGLRRTDARWCSTSRSEKRQQGRDDVAARVKGKTHARRYSR